MFWFTYIIKVIYMKKTYITIDIFGDLMIIIVGTGAGGGILAYELTKNNIPVTIIEKGPYIDSKDAFNYYDKYSDSVDLLTTTCIGGASIVAMGNMVRALDEEKVSEGLLDRHLEMLARIQHERLIHLVKEHKYTYAEMSRILNRTSGAIDHRLRVLNLKERPVVVCTSEQGATWTEEMLISLADGIRNGCTYTAIGDRVGKSEKAVRGKVYSTYYTEKLDEVRAMLRDGAWGDNRPVPIVRKAMTISTFRSGIKRNIRKMARILKHLEEIKRGERDGQHG